jgi:hypothetical protein
MKKWICTLALSLMTVQFASADCRIHLITGDGIETKAIESALRRLDYRNVKPRQTDKKLEVFTTHVFRGERRGGRTMVSDCERRISYHHAGSDLRSDGRVKKLISTNTLIIDDCRIRSKSEWKAILEKILPACTR